MKKHSASSSKAFTLTNRVRNFVGTKGCEHGFTLIELLVTIALIGVIATFLLANFNAARTRSRDTQRKSDLRNITSALRLYYNDLGVYPASDSNYTILGCGTGGTASCSWGGSWTATVNSQTNTYMSVMPSDPKSPQTYRYSRVNLDDYILQACLENQSDDKGKTTTDTTWCPSSWMYEVKP